MLNYIWIKRGVTIFAVKKNWGWFAISAAVVVSFARNIVCRNNMNVIMIINY
jgi:hypothetical protein